MRIIVKVRPVGKPVYRASLKLRKLAGKSTSRFRVEGR